MAARWVHPELGAFEYDRLGWVKILKVPAFKSFGYDCGWSTAPRPPGTIILAFEADNEEDLPSSKAVALAYKVLANDAVLVAKVITALWDDFNGRGPDSGMWWHGDLDLVVEAMETEYRPRGAGDLLDHLHLYCIRVRKRVGDRKRPLVELRFHADFEWEHGVGVLTDGKNIRGTGTCCDLRPFEVE
jgi:hypothetical protein